jgi:predicted nucleic acid-binding protein
MVRAYFDTSALVPAALAQHPNHEAALGRLKGLSHKKSRGYVSVDGIAEFYAVLTRAAFRPPIHPSEAWRMIEVILRRDVEVIALTAKESIEVTKECAAASWVGGRIHDAMHLRCARKAQCDRIYTYNVRDLRALAPQEIAASIMTP